MKTIFYKTHGTCSKLIELSADDNRIIRNVTFTGGCNGNLKGICALVKGQRLDEVHDKLAGIQCGFKLTSCPDQLSKAIEELEKQY